MTDWRSPTHTQTHSHVRTHAGINRLTAMSRCYLTKRRRRTSSGGEKKTRVEERKGIFSMSVGERWRKDSHL